MKWARGKEGMRHQREKGKERGDSDQEQERGCRGKDSGRRKKGKDSDEKGGEQEGGTVPRLRVRSGTEEDTGSSNTGQEHEMLTQSTGTVTNLQSSSRP